MKFMMLMIPAVYQDGKKVDAGFMPDPKKKWKKCSALMNKWASH